MAEPVPCPNCQTPLLIPPGVAVVACPNCKVELEVELDDPAAPAPEPPRAKPLPFGRTPAPAAEDDAPAAVPRTKPIRAKFVPEPDAPADPYAGRTPTEAEEEQKRRREIDRRLEEIDREERLAKKRYVRVEAECAAARTAVAVLILAGVGEIGTVLATGFFVALNLFEVSLWPLGALAVGLRVTQLGAFAAGFALMLGGPRPVRPLAAWGLGLSLLAAAASLVAVYWVVTAVPLAEMVFRTDSDQFLATNFPLVNANQGGTTPGDLVVYHTLGAGPSLKVKAACVAAAGFWFAATATLGTLVNYLAVGAKNRELAGKSLRFVYFLVSAIGLVTLLKALTVPLVPTDFRIVAATGAVSVFLVMSIVAWFLQLALMSDLRDDLIAERWLDDRAEL